MQLEVLGENKNQTLGLILPKYSKKTFKISFDISSDEEFNVTNNFFHRNVRIFFYNEQEYYLKVNLIIKVADNVVSKLKNLKKE
jgi:hypothetical protein